MIDLYFVRRHVCIKSLAILCMALQMSACGGVDDATSSGGGNSTSPGSGNLVSPGSGSATVSWTPPDQRADGTGLPMAEIGGYRIYYGKTSGNYPNLVDIPDLTVQEFTVTLPGGIYFFVMTTYDADGRESVFSSPVNQIKV